MNKPRVIPTILICFLFLITTGCADKSIVKDNPLTLADLLITEDDLPNPENWYAYDIRKMIFPANRLPKKATAFYSDRMLNSGRAIEEIVYLFDSVEEARSDYLEYYDLRTTYNFFSPDGWKFTQSKADENYIVCSRVDDNNHCTWVGRYWRMIVEFRSYLIPERMTLEDIENIVKEIDEKASKVQLVP